jgi:MFS family permease
VPVAFRQGWGWLVLGALTVSTIGDEITLLTLMFRTAENASAYAVPVLQAAVIGLIALYPLFTLAGATLLSVLFTISSAATFALIPVLANALGMTLARANSLLEMVRSLGMLAGPVAGGALVGWAGSRNALLSDAASFMVLALVLAMSGLRRRPQRTEREEGRCSRTICRFSAIDA